MNDIESFREEAISKWLLSEEDDVWKQWVDYELRESKDLLDLLSSEVRVNFKKRALFILLAPSNDLNPVYCKKKLGIHFVEAKFLDALSPELLDFATKLIIEFRTLLNPTHCDCLKNIDDEGDSVIVNSQVYDKYYYAIRAYNRYILQLLILLPTEKGKKIFPYYSLRDISVYNGGKDYSGYKPFLNLLSDDELEEKWKRKADLKMRKIIQDELACLTELGEDLEKVISKYANIIKLQLYSEISYSMELYAEQLKFLMDNSKGQDALISNQHVIKIFNFLSGEEYKELRHRIARYAVLENKGDFSKFRVYSEDAAAAAKQMLREFEDDAELTDKVKGLIQEGEKRFEEEKAHEAEAKKAEEKIITQML